MGKHKFRTGQEDFLLHRVTNHEIFMSSYGLKNSHLATPSPLYFLHSPDGSLSVNIYFYLYTHTHTHKILVNPKV